MSLPAKCLTLSVVMLLGLFQHALSQESSGVASGNTSLLTGVKFELSSEHPFHSDIIKAIESKPIPEDIKAALLNDLTGTAINYSDEDFTYADLKAQTVLKLVSRTVDRVVINGVTREKIVEKYVPFEKANEYGIYINFGEGVVKSATPLDQQRVVAITNKYQKDVIYFRKHMKAMSKEEQIDVVLHEQAHRMPHLFGARHAGDERFAEGWAVAFRKYLMGQTKDEQFLQILRTSITEEYFNPKKEIVCKTINCLPNMQTAPFEDKSKNWWLIEIPVTLSLPDVFASGNLGGYYVISVDNRILAQYPLLQRGIHTNILVSNNTSIPETDGTWSGDDGKPHTAQMSNSEALSGLESELVSNTKLDLMVGVLFHKTVVETGKGTPQTVLSDLLFFVDKRKSALDLKIQSQGSRVRTPVQFTDFSWLETVWKASDVESVLYSTEQAFLQTNPRFQEIYSMLTEKKLAQLKLSFRQSDNDVINLASTTTTEALAARVRTEIVGSLRNLCNRNSEQRAAYNRLGLTEDQSSKLKSACQKLK